MFDQYTVSTSYIAQRSKRTCLICEVSKHHGRHSTGALCPQKVSPRYGLSRRVRVPPRHLDMNPARHVELMLGCVSDTDVENSIQMYFFMDGLDMKVLHLLLCNVWDAHSSSNPPQKIQAWHGQGSKDRKEALQMLCLALLPCQQSLWLMNLYLASASCAC